MPVTSKIKLKNNHKVCMYASFHPQMRRLLPITNHHRTPAIHALLTCCFLSYFTVALMPPMSTMDVWCGIMYTVSKKNDNDVLHYNFNAHQPILLVFGRDIVE